MPADAHTNVRVQNPCEVLEYHFITEQCFIGSLRIIPTLQSSLSDKEIFGHMFFLSGFKQWAFFGVAGRCLGLLCNLFGPNRAINVLLFRFLTSVRCE